MTIVELYDEKPINNIVGALMFKPDKIVYVGSFSKKKFAKDRGIVIKDYLKMKGLGDIEIEYVQVLYDDLSDILDKLETVYFENIDSRFNVEVTGGEDLILIALGILCNKYPEIELFQISKRLRYVRFYNGEELTLGEKENVTLSNTVEENLMLHGASIISSNGQSDLNGENWQFDNIFLGSIAAMWELCCNGTKESIKEDAPTTLVWNLFTSALSEIVDLNNEWAYNGEVIIKEKLYVGIVEKYCRVDTVDSYLNELTYKDIVDFYTENGMVFIHFKDKQVMACLTKAGLLLELKTYLTVKEILQGRNGDVCQGVSIAWNGNAIREHNNQTAYNYSDADTINEIDVIATCGLVPYFISCKNGGFSSDELYKLSTVADKFGSGYGKKIIITTNIDYYLGASRDILIQRAGDMNIDIISNVHRVDSSAFKEALKKALDLPKVKEVVV